MKKLMLSGLVGMIISLGWMTFSWNVLPWPKIAYKKFEDDRFIGWILKENAGSRGVYVLPYPFGKKSKNMPHFGATFAFIAFDGTGGYSYTKSFVVSVLNYFVICTVLSWLLFYAKPELSYLQRVGFLMILVVTAIIMYNIANWNWWSFPWYNVALTSVNSLIGFFLASLAMAKLVVSEKGYQ